MKDKHKNVYFVRKVENNGLEKQLKWSEEKLSTLTKNCTYIGTVSGDIYEYSKTNGSISLCIVLENTNRYRENILICPIQIINKKREDCLPGINIGIIPEITMSYDFVANIQNIHFISKRRLYLKENNNNPIVLASLPNNKVIDIVSFYKSLIEKIIEKPKQYDDLYTC